MSEAAEVCLCKTSAALYCPEHEMDGPELRGRAYVELAQLYLGAVRPAQWPCDIRFVEPFGRSHCTNCGREWEAMTPKGSERHCVREVGSRLAMAESALRTLRPYIQNITLRAVIDEALRGAPTVP